jgi:hypothetical protein
MSATVCTCVWQPKPLLFGITWQHVVLDPDCTATHPAATS